MTLPSVTACIAARCSQPSILAADSRRYIHILRDPRDLLWKGSTQWQYYQMCTVSNQEIWPFCGRNGNCEPMPKHGTPKDPVSTTWHKNSGFDDDGAVDAVGSKFYEGDTSRQCIGKRFQFWAAVSF